MGPSVRSAEGKLSDLMLTAEDFFGQPEVLAPGLALLVVLEDGHAHDLGFSDPGVQFDKRFVTQSGIQLFKFGTNHLGSGTFLIEHGD